MILRTQLRPTLKVSAPVLLIAFALLLYAWTHRHALEMIGFAEDIGLVQALTAAAQSGNLHQEVIPRWLGALWGPDSTMWRPWAFTSLALDAKLYGAHSGLWHITNLLLHFAAAAFTALLARDWLRSTWAAAVVFATMLLHPWASESTLWLVGRFDGWATSAVAAALYFSWRSRGVDRWWFATLAASVTAYLSKESALILLPATAMLVVCRVHTESAGRARLRVADFMNLFLPLMAMQFAVAAVYFVLRWLAVGALSTNVYGSSSVAGLTDLIARVAAHIESFASISAASPLAASSVLLLAVLAIVATIVNRRWAVVMFASMWVTIVFIGAALHFRAHVGVGDGFRLYYLALVGFALVVGAGVTTFGASPPRKLALLVATWSLSLAVWQNAVNGEWWRAAKEIRSSADAIGKTLMTLAATDYGLVLFPDRIGAVPTMRNAQGAIVRVAPARSAGTDNVDYMVGFVPSQLDEWHRSMQKDIVRRITKRPDAPPRPTHYYCKELGALELHYLGFWEAGTLDEWRNHWRTAVRATCPSLKL